MVSNGLSASETYRRLTQGPASIYAKYVFDKIIGGENKLTVEKLKKEIKTGKTPSKSNSEFYSDNLTLNWFKPSDIGKEMYLFSSTDKLSRNCFNSGSATIFKPNTILITCIGDIGRIGILKESSSSNQQITGILFDETKILPEYAYYFFLTHRELLEENKVATTLPIINQKKLVNISIPVPQISEQKELINLFNQCFSAQSSNTFPKREKNFEKYHFDTGVKVFSQFYTKEKLAKNIPQLSQNFTKLKQSILQDAIQGKLVPQDPNDEPAEKLLEKIKAEKEKLAKEGKIKVEKSVPPITINSSIPMVPESWTVVNLNRICLKITDGFHNTPPISKNGFPYVMATHIKQEKIDFDNCYFVDELYHRELFNKARPENGDILYVNIGAGSGTPAIIEFEGEFSFKNSAILKIPRVISNKYVYYFLVYMRPKIFQEVTQGGAQPFLSLKKISELVIPLPPLNEQRRIVEKIESLIKICEEQEKNIAETKNNIEKLNQAILREVFD